MKRERKHRNFWTKEKVISIARKYTCYHQFKKKERFAYQASLRLKMTKELSKLLTRKIKPLGYWTDQKLLETALQYETLRDFRQNNSSAYNTLSRKPHLYRKVKQKMKKLGHKYKRALYVFEFGDKSAYIGITYDYQKRYNEHMNSNKTIIEKTNNFGHTFIMLNEYFPIEKIENKENMLIKEYKEKGWIILNKQKGGNLGSNFSKWNKESIIKVAIKCKSYKEFRQKHGGAYAYILKKKDKELLDVIKAFFEPSSLVRSRSKRKYSNKQLIYQGKRYNSYTDLIKRNKNLYYNILRRGLIEEIKSHYNAVA